MKHRSIGIFIVLAASLAAIPQASQEFFAFKNAVSERARVEIWSAFLNMQARGRGSVRVSPEPSPAVASCSNSLKEEAESASKKQAQRDAAARQESKGSSSRTDRNETARIIVDPSQDPSFVKTGAMFSEAPAIAGRALRTAPRIELSSEYEFAMIVPPGIGADFDSLISGAPVKGESESRRRARRTEIASLQNQAKSDAGRVKREQWEAQRVRDEVRWLIKAGVNARVMDDGKPLEGFFRVLKVKAPEKPGFVAPIARYAQPVKQASSQCSATVVAPESPAAVGE